MPFQVIRWPTFEEQEEISARFRELYNIEGVVGLLDGTHIELTGCIDGDQDYFNMARYPSMQLQVGSVNLNKMLTQCGNYALNPTKKMIINCHQFQVVVDSNLMITNAYWLARLCS
jgi:hypothetical protein